MPNQGRAGEGLFTHCRMCSRQDVILNENGYCSACSREPRAGDTVTEHDVTPAVQGDRWVCETCGRIVELSGDAERWVHTTWGQPFALPTVMVTFARHVLLRGLERVEWEDFPEVGEHDWHEVMEMAKNLANVPTTPTFQQVYDVLAARASADG